MTDQAPLLECKNLSVIFETRDGEFPVVSDFNLVLKPGDAVGIVGESGCGKTTVALAMMQYLGRNGKISRGQVLLNGQELIGLSPSELSRFRGSQIAMVYQEPMSSLNPSMRIGDQLAEVLMCHESLDAHQAKAQSLEMLNAVHVVDPVRMMRAYPHQISGGQQQRAVIAMALLAKPDVLILDEPTTALDVTVEAGIVDLIREIATKYGTSIIFISHNLGLIQAVCKRVLVMYAGEVVEEGRTDDVFMHMSHPYTRALFEAVPLPGADKRNRSLIPIRGQLPSIKDQVSGCRFTPRCDFYEGSVCDQNKIPLIGSERNLDHQFRCVRDAKIDWLSKKIDKSSETFDGPGNTILEITHLKKHYPVSNNMVDALLQGGKKKQIKANEDISFVAREGETVAIVGESGCGKSTLAKVILGLEAATSGEILFKDKDLSEARINDRTSAMVGDLQMVFQNAFDTLNPSYSIGSQIARVIRKFGIERDSQKILAHVDRLLDAVKLPREFAKRLPRQLSGGQKQRIGIVRAFAGRPSLVIADEPTSALDVSVQASIVNLLMDIQREHKTTLLYISHDLSIVRYIADRVVVMYLGHVVEQGTTEQVFAPPYHPYTEALISAAPIIEASSEKRRIILEGDLPSAIDPPRGCPFHTRCPRKIGDICEQEMPPEKNFAEGHVMRCHLDDEAMDRMISEILKR